MKSLGSPPKHEIVRDLQEILLCWVKDQIKKNAPDLTDDEARELIQSMLTFAAAFNHAPGENNKAPTYTRQEFLDLADTEYERTRRATAYVAGKKVDEA